MKPRSAHDLDRLLLQGRAPEFPGVLTRSLRWSFVVGLSFALLFYGWYTRHWLMAVDSPVMHYVVFLMRHGLKPYRDITDNNMPGSYVLEQAAMAVFGGGDAGWRMYDFFLEATLTGAMIVIAWPYDRVAGLFAGGIFALRHGSEGAWFAAEREQELTVLLAVACALLFSGVRHKRPWLVGGFGFFAAAAAAIKPTFTPFCLVTFAILVWVLRRRALSWRPYLGWGVGGMLLAWSATLLFLLRFHALGSFLFVLRTVTPVYVGLNHPGMAFMVAHLAPSELFPILDCALVAAVLYRRTNWEEGVLVFAGLCGLTSYFIQQKGFFHHRYVFLAFALLWAALKLLPRRRTVRLELLGCAVLAWSLIVVIPQYLRALYFLPGPSRLTASMEADLLTLGGDRLQQEVQCFDMTYGCLNSLYHLDLLENTGFTGDLLLFPYSPNAATVYYQDLYRTLQGKHPAEVLVMTNQEFGAANSFNRLARWPEFSRNLEENYDLVATRTFPCEDRYRGQVPWSPELAPAYRLYVRRGARVLQVPQLPSSEVQPRYTVCDR